MPQKVFSLRNKILLFIFILIFSLQIISTINQYQQIKSMLFDNMADRALVSSSEFIDALNTRTSSFEIYNDKLGFMGVFAKLEGQIILEKMFDRMLELDKIALIDVNNNLLLEKSRSLQKEGSSQEYFSSEIQKLISSNQTSILEQEDYFVVSMPVMIDSKTAAHLIFYYSNANLLVQENKVFSMNILFLMVFLVVGAFASLLVSNQITNPLIELKNSTKQFGQGNFNVKAKVSTHDEIGELATTFNEMALELKSLKDSLDRKVEERTRELTKVQHNLEKKSVQAENAKVATLNILEDVEESKEKLTEAYRQLRGLDKLKNEFLSFTSHELKTPLTPILLQAQMLEEGDFGKLTLEQKKSLEMIVRNMRELNQLIGDVLDISVIQASNLKLIPQKASMKEVITQVAEKMDSLAKQKNIKIKFELVSLPAFNFDVRRIGQVLTNFLSNAIKFTPQNGMITIKTEEKNGQILVKVIDNGIGISAENQKKLFVPFSQVVASYKLKQKGTGLGLAICKGIIEAHHGKIGVESVLGSGSTFYFSIPKKLNLD